MFKYRLKIMYFIFILSALFSLNAYAQFYKGTNPESLVDVGLGIYKIKNGYLSYSDFLGVNYVDQSEKLCYSPVFSVKGKYTDGPFKYRLNFNASFDKRDIVHDTTYFHTTSFNYRLFSPEIGFERILWSRWFEFKLAFDFMYIYELYDVESMCNGYVIPNLPLKMEALSSYQTKAFGISPFLIIGVPIKKVIFISLELGKYYAFGTTNSHYKCHSLNLNNNHEMNIDEAGKPNEYYRFDDNNYLSISIDYRFLKK